MAVDGPLNPGNPQAPPAAQAAKAPLQLKPVGAPVMNASGIGAELQTGSPSRESEGSLSAAVLAGGSTGSSAPGNWPTPRDPFRREITTAPATLQPANRSQFESRSVTESVRPALLLPLRGSGWQWLVAAGFISPIALGMVTALVLGSGAGVRGLVMMISTAAIALTLNARFFQACLAASSLESDDPGPLPDLMDWRVEFLLPGLGFGIWLLTMVFPGQVLMSMESDFLQRLGVITTIALPALTWLPGLLIYSVTGSVGALLDPRRLAGLLKAKPQLWLILYGSGALALVLSGGLSFLAGYLVPWLPYLVAGMCIPYAHGVVGGMMGRALHEHPDLVELAGYDRPEV